MAGCSAELLNCRRDWTAVVITVLRNSQPPVARTKSFKPKFPRIPLRKEYKTNADQNFWGAFPRNLVCPAKPSLKAGQLRLIANALGTSDEARLARVLQYIAEGAAIGCKGQARKPSKCTNAPSAYEFGPQVTDAIAEWIAKGYAYGPVPIQEVPVSAKISGIMVRPKPNGSVRVILNLSAPKGYSVNDGINKDDFPAKMSSTAAWLRVLNLAGRNCLITKTDWAAAYKHIHVRQDDTDLQWFEWCGMYFKELCLIFGSASSAGIFDDAAKLVLDLVCRQAKFPTHMVCQHLDDVCAAAAAYDADKIIEFDRTFQKLAASIGVELAPRDDPEKSFAPTTSGVVFGIHYDTAEWTWAVPADKLARLCQLLQAAIDSTVFNSKDMRSLAGKLIHIKPLVPAGRFNIEKIMAAYASAGTAESVIITPGCRRQLKFWLLFTQVCSGRVQIPKQPGRHKVGSLQAYTDAAGGSRETVGRGTGGVMDNWWYYIPWQDRINAGNWKVDGKKVGRKLSALELAGPLIVVAAAHVLCRGQALTVWVDNAGSVQVYNKGYSRSCRLCTTIAKAAATVAAGIGCDLQVVKVTRCSSTGPILADSLSKAKFEHFRAAAAQAAWPLDTCPAAIPLTLLHWLAKPTPWDGLGHAILKEISAHVPIPGYSIW